MSADHLLDTRIEATWVALAMLHSEVWQIVTTWTQDVEKNVIMYSKRQTGWAYAEAAFSPRPRDPPVTTATLPLSEKSEGKSAKAVSSAMVAIMNLSGYFGW